MSKKITTKIFITNAKLIHGNRYDYTLTNYFSTNKKVKIICNKHGVFEQEPNSHLKGKGCFKCGFETRVNKLLLTNEEFIIKSTDKHCNKYDYSLVKYVKGDNKIKIICDKHGLFEQVAKEHLRGHGCPRCLDSKGEENIKNYLTKNKIKFIQQKRFTNCKFKQPLPFDFYLPDYNTCIEYQGEQHFKSVTYWGGHNGLLLRKERDSIKTKYCKDNGINLIVIKYDEPILLDLF